MLQSLPTPTISTNGNGNGHAEAIVIEQPEAKQTQRKPRTKRTAKKDLALKMESRIEQFKQDLFDNATANTALLSGCYVNWFDSEIHSADYRTDFDVKPETRKKLNATLAAWKRAKELFIMIAPIVLDELMEEIAGQIELEYKDIDKVTAADVPANLRNLDLFTLMEHIN